MSLDNLTTARGRHLFAVIGREEIQNEEFDNVKDFPSELVFISISDPDKEFIQTNNHFFDELKIKFWDIDNEGICKYVPINKDQAKEIKDFILKHKDKKFLINCEAGMSRSAGVACAVEVLTRDLEYEPNPRDVISKVRQHWRYDVNELVYKMILESD